MNNIMTSIMQNQHRQKSHCNFSDGFSLDMLEAIHTASLDILQTTGMSVGSIQLQAIALDQGLGLEGDRIRFDKSHIDDALDKVGRQFTLKATNPENSVEVVRGKSLVGTGRSAPFIALPHGRQRNATAQDFIELTKLGQVLDSIELPGQLAFPGDIAADKVHRFMMVNQILHTDKPYSLLHESDLELLGMAFGINEATLTAAPDHGLAWAQTTVNTHSPLALTAAQGDYLVTMARYGIPLSISPTPAAGSTGPCSLIGNLVLNNAEILGTLVLSQLVRPGLAVLYGTFPCGSDMRSLVATYGGPETRKLESGATSMAGFYKLLTRGNVCISDAQDLDYQAGAESMFNVISAFKNGISFLPGCGISGGFATASREKLVLDAELVATARDVMKPLRTDDLEEVVELIKAVGPKGNYISSPHTLCSFRKELFHPAIFPRIPNEKWIEQNRSLNQLATQRAEMLLSQYRKPALEPLLKKHLETML